jgi:cytochrome b pre-mRNA-processing protein 3
MGDPTLGKTVRKLVGSLSRRTDLWRSATNAETDWATTTRDSLYKADADPATLDHAADALERVWARLQRAELARLEQGML